MCKENKYINIQTKEELDLNKVNELKDNAIIKNNSQLFIEWNFNKNKDLGLDIYEITKGSNKKVWWVCELEHEWEAVVSDRYNGTNCPYCSNNKVLNGYNDIWSTNYSLASKLLNPEDGHKYTQGSGQRVDWKCECGVIIKNKKISNIRLDGLSCPNCSDGKSFPEKVVYQLLKMAEINFECERVFEWSNNKRYDFYIPETMTIIEVHGSQHYRMNYYYSDDESVAESKYLDKYKMEIAYTHGIKDYIVINASTPTMSFIKNSIIKSNLSEIVDLSNIDFVKLEANSLKSHHYEILKLWNEELMSAEQISNCVNYKLTTVRKILKKWNSLNLCSYNRNESLKRNGENKGKTVLQYSKDGVFIREFISATSAAKSINGQPTCIIACCKGRQISSGGFIWKYKI